jgi:hypothetical protein
MIYLNPEENSQPNGSAELLRACRPCVPFGGLMLIIANSMEKRKPMCFEEYLDYRAPASSRAGSEQSR